VGLSGQSGFETRSPSQAIGIRDCDHSCTEHDSSNATRDTWRAEPGIAKTNFQALGSWCAIGGELHWMKAIRRGVTSNFQDDFVGRIVENTPDEPP
jgi:hypothetical protein